MSGTAQAREPGPPASYLFAEHPEPVLRAWAQRLHVFRFCRARGGHASEGDRLRACFAVQSREDVLQTFSTLGLPPREVTAETMPPPGQGWVNAQAYRDLITIKGFEPLAQPGETELFGQPASVQVLGERCYLELTSTADIWAVDEAAVERAAKIESHLQPLLTRWVDPPQDDRWCLCPQFYPEWFA